MLAVLLVEIFSLTWGFGYHNTSPQVSMSRTTLGRKEFPEEGAAEGESRASGVLLSGRR